MIASVDLGAVRRHNRRRLVALGVLAMVNLWVVVTVIGSVGVYLATSWTFTRAFWPVGGVMAIGVIAYVVVQVQLAARGTLNELGATELHPGEWQRTSNLIDEIAIATGTQRVRVAVLEDPVPNALTVGAGRRSTVLVVTRGLVATLSRDELEAVIAVQLCSVARLDVALRTVVVACATGALSMPHLVAEYMADVAYPTVVRVLTTPSRLVAAALRRSAFTDDDFGADEMAVAITRNPEALRRALEKLLAEPGVVQRVTPSNAPLWFEPMPFTDGDRPAALERFSMTPSLEARIARLDSVGRS